MDDLDYSEIIRYEYDIEEETLVLVDDGASNGSTGDTGTT